MNQARRFLIPFPNASEGLSSPEDTVCSVPCPDKLFQPARRKWTLPRTVSLPACAAGIAAAFLSGAILTQLTMVAPPAVEIREKAKEAYVQPPNAAEILPVPAGIVSESPSVTAPKLRRIRFALDESRKFRRVGPLELRLKKADARKQTFTLTLQMKDKRVELRDRNVAEPIRLQPLGGLPSEILVHRIDSDHVEGYLRVHSR